MFAQFPPIPGSSTYRVYEGGPFTSIQSAIDQAVTDGYTSSNNPAVIEIYPGTYNEILTLQDGVSLVGMPYKGKNRDVTINGGVTWSPTHTSGAGGNVSICGLTIVGTTGNNTVSILGTVQGRMYLNDCYIDKVSGTESVILVNNSGRAQLYTDDLDGNVGTASVIYDIQSGSIYAINGSGSIIGLNETFASKIFNCDASGVVYVISYWGACTGTDAITVAAGGQVTLLECNITNSQANGNGANVASGGQLTAFQTFYSIPAGTGHVVYGSGTYINSNCFFSYGKNTSITGVTKLNILDDDLSSAGILQSAGAATLGTSGGTSVHALNGGVEYTTRSITGSLTVDTTSTDHYILANTTSAALTVTLPAPVRGRRFKIKDSGGVAGTNNITVSPHSTEKIDGAASQTITTNYGSLSLISDGTNWFLV